jgi:hypothetical protein
MVAMVVSIRNERSVNRTVLQYQAAWRHGTESRDKLPETSRTLHKALL